MNELEVIKDRIATNIKDCTISVTCGDVCGSRLCILCVHGKERVVVMRVDEETIDRLIAFLRKAKETVRGRRDDQVELINEAVRSGKIVILGVSGLGDVFIDPNSRVNITSDHLEITDPDGVVRFIPWSSIAYIKISFLEEAKKLIKDGD